ncbi:MAG: hypothetical protein JNG85_12815 [Spirochaetaceae bacterium]|nr:hypothetical protein [Spirochaetaceae bacterium]
MSALGLAIAEWGLWKRRHLRWSLPAEVLLLAAASLPLRFAPFLLCASSGALAVLLGWNHGFCWKRGSSFSALGAGLPPGRIVAGRLLAGLAVYGFHLLLAAPPLILALSSGGLSAALLAAWAGLWLAAYAMAAGLGFLAGLLLGPTEHLVGGYVLAAWFLPGLFQPQALLLNPLVQAWSLARGGGPGRPVLGAALELLVAALAFAAAGLLLARNGTVNDARA